MPSRAAAASAHQEETSAATGAQRSSRWTTSANAWAERFRISRVFRRQGQGHLVSTVFTAGLKIVPTQAVYAATKNAVRTLLEGLRQESTDGVLRTTAVSPGFVRTELADSIDNPEVREQIRRSRDEFAISPDAVARAIAFAVEQPCDVEIGDITIRPAVQG
jgi:NADP-dependent 3-hydroxy acid dehydrogenase YdfG